MREQFLRRRLVGNEAAGKNITRSNPVAQRDAPFPAGLQRGRLGIRRHPGIVALRQCPGAIAQQIIRPADVRIAKRLLDGGFHGLVIVRYDDILTLVLCQEE